MQLIVCILSQNIGFYVGYDTPRNLAGFRQILAVTLACWYSFTWHRGYNSPAGDTWQYVTRVVTLGSAWRFSRTINSSVRQPTTLRDVSSDLYSHFLAVSSLFAVFFCHCWQDIFRSGPRPRSLSKYHSRRV